MPQPSPKLAINCPLNLLKIHQFLSRIAQKNNPTKTQKLHQRWSKITPKICQKYWPRVKRCLDATEALEMATGDTRDAADVMYRPTVH